MPIFYQQKYKSINVKKNWIFFYSVNKLFEAMSWLNNILLFCFIKYVIMKSTKEELLSKDPSLWPGHMEPFGSKQKTIEVETLDAWPEPIPFFTEYVDKNQPVLFKGLAKKSPAFKLFNDNYLKSYSGADKVMIYAEPELKENRTKGGWYISFKSFIERYHHESLYMVSSLPEYLRKDVRIPSPLRCDDTKRLLSSQVTWFSSGGTKSVVHNDDVDNINCLFRGSKELKFIEYMKNKKFVPIDQPQGGYSSLDVDKVNYTAFPMLRHVDQYVHATMHEGDCLFIPYHWFHQVNSIANENGQNLAINVWFKHVHYHRPRICDISESEATLDKYDFSDNELEPKVQPDEGEGMEETDEVDNTWEHFESYLFKTKQRKANFQTFVTLLKRDSMVNRDNVKLDELPEDFITLAIDLFEKFDKNKDKVLAKDDFDQLRKVDDDTLNDLEQYLTKQIARIEDFFEDVVEDAFQNKEAKKAAVKSTEQNVDTEATTDQSTVIKDEL